ncbi:hypothetical protein AB1Y20_023091 [Prymnesium parvum]|uniref:GB1/RHD3-type G domain-containing protein n=1 Tax=Prymnesium parvum TaxID=97485 RepID=A0AB34JFR9_PRYPA
MAEGGSGNFLTDFVQRVSARWSTDSDAMPTAPAAAPADAPVTAPPPAPPSTAPAASVPSVGASHAFSERKPLPFIQVDAATKKLVVTDEARAALSQLDGSIGVCAVAGLYRTGKSYILNQLAGQNAGFGIGSSVQACTKGVWMWGAPMSHVGGAAGAPKNLLLLDTEGLSSISQTEGHDAKIFCLAILLSSIFVYNSEKAINSGALDQLSLVVQLIKKIRVHAEGADEEGALSQFFPQFIWLLRDFQLELVDEAGRPISEQQYLEECLKPKEGASAAVKEQNDTRTALTELFRKRSCVTLAHPTLGTNLKPEALKALPDLAQLAPGFRDGVTRLKQQVLMSVGEKKVSGTTLDGPMLLGLTDAYVKAINEGALPTISTAWQNVVVIECERAVKAGAALYRDGAAAAANSDPPLAPEEWEKLHTELRGKALATFRAIAVGDSSEYEGQMLQGIEAEAATQRQLLTAKSEALCLRIVGALSDQLAFYSRNGPGAKSTHAEALPKLLEHVISEYHAKAAGPGKADGFVKLLKSEVIPVVGDVLRKLESSTQTEIDTYEGRQARLQRQLEAAQADAARLGKQTAEIEKLHEGDTQKLARLEKEKGDLATAIAQLSADKAALDAQLAKIKKKRGFFGSLFGLGRSSAPATNGRGETSAADGTPRQQLSAAQL